MSEPYEWAPGADSLSGAEPGEEGGAGYERTLRTMISAGMRWFDAHPDSPLPEVAAVEPGARDTWIACNPEVAQEAGLLELRNDSARSIVATLEGASGRQCSYMQVVLALHHVSYARRVGWEAYQAYLVRRAANPDEPLPDAPPAGPASGEVH
jgi:hypothetical protein